MSNSGGDEGIASRARSAFDLGRGKVRAWLRRVDNRLDRRRLPEDAFIDQLKALGVRSGATVYVHTSMDEIGRRVPTMDAPKLVRMLIGLVGEEGTLLAPTFSFRGSQHGYVRSRPIFHVKRTPSKVGLFTEVFRRTNGVTRSWHPTHSLAAWGRLSNELLHEHHLGTAFGRNSPIYKMQQHDGIVVGIGVLPKRCFTLYHVAEELHPLTHAMQYGAETFDLTITDGDRRIEYRIVPLRPDRLRRYDRADRILQREGVLRFHTVEGLKLSVAPIEKFLRRCDELIDEGRFYSWRSGIGI